MRVRRKPQLPCEGCGARIEDGRRTRKFCTLQCRVDFVSGINREERRSHQEPCRGCGVEITGLKRKYCTPHCGQRHHTRMAIELGVRLPKIKPKGSCKGCGKPLPKFKKTHCSRECYDLHYYGGIKALPVMPTEVRGICSICKENIVQTKGYSSRDEPMMPLGVDLCSRHRRGYGAFISKNGYRGYDPDEIYAVYLVRLTFPNAGRQPHMVMIREAIKTAQGS